MVGPEILGAALARLPDDVIVLGLPPTVYGKSVEHEEWPGTITYSGDTLRAVMMDVATSVARAASRSWCCSAATAATTASSTTTSAT